MMRAVKMSNRADQRSPFAKNVTKMLKQYGIEAVLRNAHMLGGWEQDCIRVCIAHLSDERPLPLK